MRCTFPSLEGSLQLFCPIFCKEVGEEAKGHQHSQISVAGRETINKAPSPGRRAAPPDMVAASSGGPGDTGPGDGPFSAHASREGNHVLSCPTRGPVWSPALTGKGEPRDTPLSVLTGQRVLLPRCAATSTECPWECRTDGGERGKGPEGQTQIPSGCGSAHRLTHTHSGRGRVRGQAS